MVMPSTNYNILFCKLTPTQIAMLIGSFLYINIQFITSPLCVRLMHLYPYRTVYYFNSIDIRQKSDTDLSVRNICFEFTVGHSFSTYILYAAFLMNSACKC